MIVAMAGASWEHNLITDNFGDVLRHQMKDGPCVAVTSDLRVRVPACDKYCYPNVVVVCGEPQFEDAHADTLLNPTLIVEVLSDSTEKTDREEKFDCYRTLESLAAYVLAAQDKPRVECFTRQPDGSWRFEVAKGLDAALKLDTIGCTLRLADIYARVPFPTEQTA
jgi:Uma2 family endonuclease